MNGSHRRAWSASALLLAGSLASACTDDGSRTMTKGDDGTFKEKALDVKLALSGTTLTITTRDGATPVMTDAWLYTLEDGKLSPLTGFSDPDSKRRYRGLMLPCTIDGAPSGLSPCDAGELNGVMTDRTREQLQNGEKVSAIDGTVAVTLDAAPTSPVVVVVAREDQRYHGAAAVDPGGAPVAVPAGVDVAETHVARTYTRDVKPIVEAHCVGCHAPGAMVEDKPLHTYDAIVNGDFGYAGAVAACAQQFPSDPAGLEGCKQAITKSEYMVERGAPANSNFTRRTLPDADDGASTAGLAWFGNKTGDRFDAHGDRRMPPTNTTMDTSDDDAKKPTWFDGHAKEYEILWSWVAQGAPE